VDRETRLYVNRELVKVANRLSDLRRHNWFDEKQFLIGIKELKKKLTEVENVLEDTQLELWKEK
jgi:hypothetical protein